jgi:hypothetical protein
VDEQVFNLAYFLQELTIIDSHMRQFSPSKIAAASIYFAKKMLQRETPWCAQMMLHTGYNIKQVRDCARAICIILNKTTRKKQSRPYKAILDKFSLKKFLLVAYIPARMRYEAQQRDENTLSDSTKLKRDASDAHMRSEE